MTGLVTRSDVTLTADPSRVLARLFVPGHELSFDAESRAGDVLSRILALPEELVGTTLRRVLDRYAGHDEVYTAGDAYYGAPGHLPLLFAGTELVEFSPTGALNETMAVVGKNLEATRPGGA